MAGVVAKFEPRELLIHTPDGKVRALPLDRDRMVLGRSSSNELSYADDAGLSRQHLVFERTDGGWTVSDLSSKNGTFVNGERLTAPHVISESDRITAGHLGIEFRRGRPAAPNTVVFVEGKDTGTIGSNTVVASLQGLLEPEKE